jgi:hypothetical protein
LVGVYAGAGTRKLTAVVRLVPHCNNRVTRPSRSAFRPRRDRSTLVNLLYLICFWTSPISQRYVVLLIHASNRSAGEPKKAKIKKSKTVHFQRTPHSLKVHESLHGSAFAIHRTHLLAFFSFVHVDVEHVWAFVQPSMHLLLCRMANTRGVQLSSLPLPLGGCRFSHFLRLLLMSCA